MFSDMQQQIIADERRVNATSVAALELEASLLRS
jgi:hypothetical protein